MEEELRGGKSTPNIVKIGNTVRRPSKESSIFVSEILKHLENKGCPYTPRFLGFDEKNREMYEYIEGVVPTDVGGTTIEQLETFMRMLKNIHDNTEELTGTGDVICHHDLSPCNVVFRGGIPISIIDWDSCFYGKRWEDLTYSVWSWINLGSHQRNTKI
jgi:Putative homoserine kinase type II (protein kinase fold)